ncbi:hypothetical protein TUZN_0920 [Thermoproteus uzoniensis 768-20]|uniref:Uncharacterized protein n=1 Tax=Thermoproteus uzoniensis (strain 768-20) TaxID=999630 RepID=F2L5V8_THEU7|nr:hypothetical protein TUZN_0920 [Thermoproteus uzoniensis 768-20]
MGEAGGYWGFLISTPIYPFAPTGKVSYIKGRAYFVTSDYEYIYVVGSEIFGNYSYWHIEKRDLNLDLIAEYTSPNMIGIPQYVGIDPVTGQLWVVGDTISGGNATWAILVLNRNLTKPTVLKPGLPGRALGVAFDDAGDAYVYGRGGIVKYSPNGTELASFTGNFTIVGVVYAGNLLYVVTADYKLLILDLNLNKINVIDLEPLILNNIQNEYYGLKIINGFGKIITTASDGLNIYAIGTAMPGPDVHWAPAVNVTGVIYFSISIPLPAVPVSVSVVDGFGSVEDWHIDVVYPSTNVLVASGDGVAKAKLLQGTRYIARIYGPGFFYSTTFVVNGSEIVVRVPTGRLSARVVDSFGRVVDSWPVEIVGVASGNGTVGPLEVLAGNYVVAAKAFGKKFEKAVVVEAGEVVNAVVQIPTANLSIVVVNSSGRQIQPSEVLLEGPISMSFQKPPAGLELLAGNYTVEILTEGKNITEQIELKPGEVKTVKIVVPTGIESSTTSAVPTGTAATVTTTAVLTVTSVVASSPSVSTVTVSSVVTRTIIASSSSTLLSGEAPLFVIAVAASVAVLAAVLAVRKRRKVIRLEPLEGEETRTWGTQKREEEGRD